MDSAFSHKNISRFILFSSFAAIFVSIFYPVLTTLALAVIFALVLNPFIKKIQKINFFGISIKSIKKCTTILMFFIITIFIVPFGVMSIKIYSQFKEFTNTQEAKQEFMHKFSQYLYKIEEDISHLISRFGLKHQITVDDISGGLAQKTTNYIFDTAGYVLTQIPSTLLSFIIFLVALFYLLAESDKIENFFRQLGLFSFREINIIGESLKVSSYSAMVSTIIAGLVHGLIMAIGARVMGIGDFSIIFMLTFFLSFIPVVGATIMALGLCAPALIDQNYSTVFILLGIGLLASGIDNIVRPYFLVYENHLVHPFIALLSVIGGISVFGIAGLIIGPVLVQVTIESLPKLVRLAPNPKVRVHQPDDLQFIQENHKSPELN